jgi:hypothetical protein
MWENISNSNWRPFGLMNLAQTRRSRDDGVKSAHHFRCIDKVLVAVWPLAVWFFAWTKILASCLKLTGSAIHPEAILRMNIENRTKVTAYLPIRSA